MNPRSYQVQPLSTPTGEFLRHVIEGLAASPQKYLLPRYFYDERSSQLFERICVQPEYYLTRTEAQILKACCHDIVDATCSGAKHVNVVELGSGSSIKTRILFRALIASEHRFKIEYIPIDISRSALVESANLISGDFPELSVRQIVGDYAGGLETAAKLIQKRSRGTSERKIVLFLGSSIGNMDEDEACDFLRMLYNSLGDDDWLLVGFDLEKDRRTIERAYDDAAGVTALFNLNVLERINRELGGKFDTSAFSHSALYNEVLHRAEMHLVSAKDQSVLIGAAGKSFTFARGESIHTESSYKYSVERIEALAGRCGLKAASHYTDGKKWFDLCLLRRA